MENPIKKIANAYESWEEKMSVRLHIYKAMGPKCPICQKSFKGHAFTALGRQSVFAQGKDYELRDFEEAGLFKFWKQHTWNEMFVLPSSLAVPTIMAGALHCPHDGKIETSLLIIPFDSWELWQVLHTEILSAADAKKLKNLIDPLHWIALD